MTDERLDYIVGQEISLTELIESNEALNLLKGAIRAGAHLAALSGGGLELSIGQALDGDCTLSADLRLEGEPVARVSITASRAEQGMLGLLTQTLQSLIDNSLKRRLTTEIHTQVVNRSYEDLLAINARLSASEARYRELAAELEVKVQERTHELKQTYSRLIQQEKMAAIGQLAAGMAHEINNPLGFIQSNLRTLAKYGSRIRELLDDPALRTDPIQALRQQLKIDLIMADWDDILSQSIRGSQRVAEIISDLRDFSHIDDAGTQELRISTEIEKTLRVMQPEIPAAARVDCRFTEHSTLHGNAAALCQAFMNIIRNSLQARSRDLQLKIMTWQSGDLICITFSDNGPGIRPEIAGRIFEPFFTTRDIGQGMGLGLSVAHDIITAHHGTITAVPQTDGAQIKIELPASGP